MSHFGPADSVKSCKIRGGLATSSLLFVCQALDQSHCRMRCKAVLSSLLRGSPWLARELAEGGRLYLLLGVSTVDCDTYKDNWTVLSASKIFTLTLVSRHGR